jgi:hypothetical protein
MFEDITFDTLAPDLKDNIIADGKFWINKEENTENSVLSTCILSSFGINLWTSRTP